MAGRFDPLGHRQQDRNGRDGPRRDLHGRRGKRQREQAELAGDFGAGEDAVSGDVVGTGWPGGYDALQERAPDVVFVHELKRKRGNQHREVGRAPDPVAAQPRYGPGQQILVIGFTTLAEHSRLCLAFPSTVGPGAQMYTKSRTLQKVALEDLAPLVAELIGEAGIDLSDIDYLIPHQTSARAIRKGTEEFARRLGAKPKHVVVNLEEYGNTSSTTLFVALHKYLEEQRLRKGDRVMLLALPSGVEIGMAIFTIDNEVDRYGITH
jgi:3-Oxoacyl-[acyl-carrier-protein (ACP)] synthase III C terminal